MLKRITVSLPPTDLIEALLRLSHDHKRSVNDLVAEMLADACGASYAPSGRLPSPSPVRLRERMVIRVEEEVWICLKRKAVPFFTLRDIVIEEIKERLPK